MLDDLFQTDHRGQPAEVVLGALNRASGSIGRLDQTLANHPLLLALLYRSRWKLSAVKPRSTVTASILGASSGSLMVRGFACPATLAE